jgi:putative transposase
MQQTSVVQKRLYHINNIDERDYSPVVWERKEKLDKMALLLNEGTEESIALEALNLKRSTYYRWKKNYNILELSGLEDESRRPHKLRKESWDRKTELNVYHLRKKYPLWGKQKITVMYKREYGTKLSESTVGRILTKLLKQGKIMPVRFMFGKRDTKKRVFNGHAQRWKHGMKATQPGELIQVDHMSIAMPGIGQVKHFNAVCPITKYAVYQVYKEANSRNAADFLKLMQQSFPFKVLSIQVDGGSEFMSTFEEACYKAKIPLWVLPPRSPKLNGTVERGNGTAKYEFYAQYDAHPTLHILQKRLLQFSHFYNTIRPHQGIDLLTPQQFYEVLKIRPQSHMY